MAVQGSEQRDLRTRLSEKVTKAMESTHKATEKVEEVFRFLLGTPLDDVKWKNI